MYDWKGGDGEMGGITCDPERVCEVVNQRVFEDGGLGWRVAGALCMEVGGKDVAM